MSNPFQGIDDAGNTGYIGEEVSPYMMVGLGVQEINERFPTDHITPEKIEACRKRLKLLKSRSPKRVDL